MSIFDIILLIIISAFGLAGFWFGIVHTLISLVGMIMGIFLALRWYEPIALWLIEVTGWGENFTKVLLFVILFFVINRLVSLAFWILDKFISIFTRLPIVRSLDRLLGLLFGIFEGALGLGIIFYFIAKVPIGENFMQALSASVVAPYTVKLAGFLIPFFPEAIKVLKSAVDGWM